MAPGRTIWVGHSARALLLSKAIALPLSSQQLATDPTNCFQTTQTAPKNFSECLLSASNDSSDAAAAMARVPFQSCTSVPATMHLCHQEVCATQRAGTYGLDVVRRERVSLNRKMRLDSNRLRKKLHSKSIQKLSELWRRNDKSP